MNSYKGYFQMGRGEYPFVFSDFILSISTGERITNEQVLNGWIHLKDINQHELFVKMDNDVDFRSGEYICRAIAYINVYRPGLGFEKLQPQIKSLIFHHDIIDFMFQDEKSLDMAIYLLQIWKSNYNIDFADIKHPDIERRRYERPVHTMKIGDKMCNLNFGIESIFNHTKAFPYEIYNCINIKSESFLSLNDIYNIAISLKMFLQLISQTRVVNLEKIRLGYENNYYADLYIRAESELRIIRERVFDYEDIKDGLESIFNQISMNKICFRSLFNYSDNEITTFDIMNICAAFESQFKITHPKFKDKNQKRVKRSMIDALRKTRDSYNEGDRVYFDEILKNIELYNDTLQRKLELVLSEFEKLYQGSNSIELFNQEYGNFPKRMKDTRNALDHGNTDYIITNQMFLDTQLLRAMTYMLILKESGIGEQNVKKCIDKMRRSNSVFSEKS